MSRFRCRDASDWTFRTKECNGESSVVANYQLKMQGLKIWLIPGHGPATLVDHSEACEMFRERFSVCNLFLFAVCFSFSVCFSSPTIHSHCAIRTVYTTAVWSSGSQQSSPCGLQSLISLNLGASSFQAKNAATKSIGFRICKFLCELHKLHKLSLYVSFIYQAARKLSIWKRKNRFEKYPKAFPGVCEHTADHSASDSDASPELSAHRKRLLGRFGRTGLLCQSANATNWFIRFESNHLMNMSTMAATIDERQFGPLWFAAVNSLCASIYRSFQLDPFG